jgi:hypothetical protein
MDPMALGQMKDVFMMLTMWAFFGAALYIVATTLHRRQRNQMQQHMLDKFASAKDFADFVQSPAGQKYAMSFADTAASAKASILNAVRLGIVLIFTGFGLQTMGSRAMRFGLLVVTIGIGFLVSAAISYVLSRKLQVNGEE